jgi:hypothetical protein
VVVDGRVMVVIDATSSEIFHNVAQKNLREALT